MVTHFRLLSFGSSMTRAKATARRSPFASESFVFILAFCRHHVDSFPLLSNSAARCHWRRSLSMSYHVVPLRICHVDHLFIVLTALTVAVTRSTSVH